ncbi:E3 ubiquitin-protein ligase UBR2 [Osmia bicornis bicornis]|uniref:E3 ubiquitin-protein ligase UBR2 n=1 Tax=Osmia bicornis bicornis TaxID=1437191 RepID=UPI001EAF6327|nr:E3 ubiquitin-protein ligase UBR2 [Osmia bicornis bicornis]XP_029032052.2 E3 ubiquitin-protein ligase UBR2 [Osmia bicornis bicornis]XP_029032053.2 E3 ubiquitin-protein ligase UBR2 [Osmia bicornis bicornis]
MNNEHQNIEDMESSPAVSSDLPNFSNPCVNTWIEKMNKGVLSCNHFKEHWRIWVPKIYSPEPDSNCLDWNFDEEKAQKVLYNTLEEFICNGDPQVVLKQISQTDNVICGKVFKMGEATYSCRECGVDSTCVLCVDCFKQSAHRNHKYRMGTSCGGGCCDCGDIEAWKKEPFCNIHLAGIQAKEARGNKLPGDIAERAVVAFEAVLRYCYEILSLEHTPGLPADLCVKETDDNPLSLPSTSDHYCTVLFNDETHTFDQVIATLTRVMNCSQRDALEFVTSVDRDGRAVVECSDFQRCKDLKNDIEKFTSRHNNRALKVLVVHVHVIAHQIFAMKLLHWLQQFISPCEGFRVLFSNVALNTKLPVISIVEGILMRDSQLWKSARTAWHRLLMSGMLMEYESKKAFAIVFTYNYGSVMKDYIRDDHDHSFSIVSFSVQLFTVPTLAHHLIAHHDVLFILLNTFISESSRKCNAAGKLEFERDTPNTTFKRALYMLQDLRYLLSYKPDVWTDELRKSFLQGLSLLLTLLSSMQCMDAVVRQVGQHMEYEPEWESAFNLHIRLSPVISLALQWCGSDQIVLIKAFRLVLRRLYEQPGHEIGPPQVRELADHSATCLQYDVSSEPVSIHLPLSRFLAGLFPYLEKHDLHFQCAEFINHTKPTLEQIIEPVLATQVMIAQVHSGMWKRNGYSLLNQLYFYHNVKCRSEMLDKDIILLQAGASLIESNEFLIHVLNKFNLLQWASPDFDVNAVKYLEDESIRQTLVEEFLGLLITIIGERYVLGVGQVTPDDILKKEIIQQLCIKPLSHSELTKTLSDDTHWETEMEKVIHDVADFKKPSGASGAKGVYELKPHLYSEYNVFFYHYTKEEVSNSEETQRKRRKALGELECCPPPKLPKLTEVFSLVTNLLQCDVILHIMKIVLERALNCRPRRFSESQIHKILHLIGYALQEQESGYYPFFAFTARAAKWNICKLLEDLSNSPRVEAYKDLLTWVLTKYREVAGYTSMEVTTAAALCTESTTENVESDKEWRTKMAAEKRARIMAQMAAMQKHFMKENAELFEEASLDVNKSNDRDSNINLSECSQKTPVAVGIGQPARMSEEETYKTCILCQENQAVTATGPAMVLAAFVQQSTVLCQNRATLMNTDESNPLYLSSKLGASPHTSTCGHVMHVHCWQEYFNNVLAKENRRPFRLRQPAGFDVEKHEYLCPLCECLSNTVLPLLPALGTLQPTPQNQPELDFGTWLEALKITECNPSGKLYKAQSSKENNDFVCPICVNTKPLGSLDDGSLLCPTKAIRHELGNVATIFESAYGQSGVTLSENLISTIHFFAQATYAKQFGAEPHEGDSRVPLLAWKSTAYSIHAIESLLQDMDKPLFGALSSRQRDNLEGLARISAVLGSTCVNGASTNLTWADKDTIGRHALSLLTLLLKNPDDGASILDWDPFGVLIPLINSLPSLFSTKFDMPPSIITGGVCEFYALQLVFISHIVQILLTLEFNKEMDIDDEDESENTYSESILIMAQALNINVGTQTAVTMWKQVKEACLPFLRCCALYFHYITDVPAPEELTKVYGATYENICAYLGLPTTCDELVKPNLNIIIKLIDIWKSHPTVQMHSSGTRTVTIIKKSLKVNKLVELPEDYSELINMISSFTCPNSVREDSKTPTLCLVCGEMLCSQSYCCQFELNNAMVGACTYHASKCGAGVGLFLRIRECEILFLRIPNRGFFACPPYLDEYGETDQGLRRGNPLRLCHDRYRQLNQLWLGHGLYESISRAIESSSSPISTRWQHL